MNGGGDNRRRDWRDTTRISKKQKLILNSEEQLESKLGFDVFTEGDKRLGWLLTLASVLLHLKFYLFFCVEILMNKWILILYVFWFNFVVVMGGSGDSQSVQLRRSLFRLSGKIYTVILLLIYVKKENVIFYELLIEYSYWWCLFIDSRKEKMNC